MTVADATEHSLRQAGLRVTRQRVAILDAIHQAQGHPTAGELHDLLEDQGQPTSLATVYRTLATLAEAHLVEPHYLGPGHEQEHYEAAEEQEHFHFVCRNCGAVHEFRSDHLDRLREDLYLSEGWVLQQTCMCFEGLCKRCAEAE